MSDQYAKSLLSLLKATGRLPSPVGVAIRVLELARSNESTIDEIAETIMSDPALSGRLLKYANSVAVGARRPVTSVRDAVLLMGLRAVKLAALGFSVATPGAEPRCAGFDYRRFWIESFVRSVIARRVAAEHFGVDREEAFTAGLLAGMGRLALAHGLAQRYAEILAGATASKPLEEVERDALGANFAQFGGQLLADWKLPDLLVHAVMYQLHPQEAPEDSRPLAAAVHLAAQLLPLFDLGDGQQAPPEAVAEARGVVHETLSHDEASWTQLADEVLADFRQVAEIFEIGTESEVSVAGLCAEAQEEATRTGLVAQIEQNRALDEVKQLLQRAATDSLTGIANRAKFDEELEGAIKGLKRGHGDFVVLMFDIDHFKTINDTYGHKVGDLVLQQVAHTAQRALRDVDLVARYGGDEFVMLAPQTGRAGACVIAERLRGVVERLSITAGERQFKVTISAGFVATADYAERPTADQLVSDADKQLYVAKMGGRNTWAHRDHVDSQDAA